MKCPSCAKAGMVRERRDLSYTYKGEETTIPNVLGDYCAACDETLLDGAEAQRTSELMLAFNKQVNAMAVDPEFITSVRKKLELDQRTGWRDFRWWGQCLFEI